MSCIATLCIALLLIAAPAQAAGLKVVVSIVPQEWFVERIAGDLAEVSAMVPPGATPHGFEPRPSSMRAVAGADVYLALGLEFERAWLPRFLAANPGLRVAHTEAGIDKGAAPGGNHEPMHEGEEQHGEHHGDAPLTPGHEAVHHDGDDTPHHDAAMPHDASPHEGAHHDAQAVHHDDDDAHHEAGGHHHHGGEDPHVWLSPELAKTMARNIRDALAQADPGNAAAYDAGLARMLDEIAGLQADIAARFTGLKRRQFMIFHPSWGWFAREFGLEQLPVEVGGREPKPAELVRLVERARSLGIRTVFVQPQASRRAAEVLARELDGSVAEADPLAADWAANLRAVADRLALAMRE